MFSSRLEIKQSVGSILPAMCIHDERLFFFVENMDGIWLVGGPHHRFCVNGSWNASPTCWASVEPKHVPFMMAADWLIYRYITIGEI